MCRVKSDIFLRYPFFNVSAPPFTLIGFIALSRLPYSLLPHSTICSSRLKWLPIHFDRLIVVSASTPTANVSRSVHSNETEGSTHCVNFIDSEPARTNANSTANVDRKGYRLVQTIPHQSANATRCRIQSASKSC